MKPSQKAFYFLIDMEEWDLAFEISKNVSGLNSLHVNLVRIINDQPPQDIYPEWLLNIPPHTIFEFDEFVSAHIDKDKYSNKLLWVIIQKRYKKHFCPLFIRS